jgi:hypothetical protein
MSKRGGPRAAACARVRVQAGGDYVSARREHRFLLRMPEAVFRQLRQEAKRRGQSINHEIVRRINIGRAERMEIATLDVAIEGIDSVISALTDQRRKLQAERVRLRRRLKTEPDP